LWILEMKVFKTGNFLFKKNYAEHYTKVNNRLFTVLFAPSL